MIEIDIVGKTDTCGKDCKHLIEGWKNWLLSERPFGKVIFFEKGFKHRLKPALITITTEEDYLKMIKTKGKYMINKCLRKGYISKEISYNDYLEDIYEINTSKKFRQGKPMSESYLQKPVKRSDTECCDIHNTKFFGVLKDDKLYAYCNVSFMNDMAIMNTIIGHGEHLTYGIMNLLIYTMVKNCKNVKYLNYLTLNKTSLSDFKRSVGFKEVDVIYKNFKK